MALDDNDWKMVGAGLGGVLLGIVGGSLFTKQKPAATGLSRAFHMKGARKSEIAINIMTAGEEYTLEYETPYGIVGPDGQHDEDLDHEVFEEFEGAGTFLAPEDAAEAADEIMEKFGFTPLDHWTDSLDHALKDERPVAVAAHHEDEDETE